MFVNSVEKINIDGFEIRVYFEGAVVRVVASDLARAIGYLKPTNAINRGIDRRQIVKAKINDNGIIRTVNAISYPVAREWIIKGKASNREGAKETIIILGLKISGVERTSFLQNIKSKDDLYVLDAIASNYGMSVQDFSDMLYDNKIIKRSGKFFQGWGVTPINRSKFSIAMTNHFIDGRSEDIVILTQRGATLLYDRLKGLGIFPSRR